MTGQHPGGVVPASPGARLVVLHEGPEAFVPLSGRMLRGIPATNAREVVADTLAHLDRLALIASLRRRFEVRRRGR